MATQQEHPMQVLHRGAKSEAARALQAATNRRLQRRGLSEIALDEDGVIGGKTMAAVTTAAWALGARRETIAELQKGEIPIGVQRMIRNPGRRNDEQKARGKKRLVHLRAMRKKRAAALAASGSARKRVIELAQKAAANYRANPRAYHYLAGGKANTEFLKPTPRDWRSDCSQFVAAVYKAAGLPSPATVSHESASTFSIDPKGKLTTRPRPGDLGMYGVHGGKTHHVELYCGLPGQEFIGHGSPPIDSVTPGRPDYYLTYDFLR
jgi:cell wall-associated NlpC family hydrolase